jgi:hypothetical protein
VATTGAKRSGRQVIEGARERTPRPMLPRVGAFLDLSVARARRNFGRG